MKAINHEGDLNKFLDRYNYQPDLVNHLDDLKGKLFDQSIINEIVLWKVNRSVKIEEKIFHSLNELVKLNAGEHRKAEDLLHSLLGIRGIDLPMASTILRFRNPDVFQIIDRRAYRSVYDVNYPLYHSSTPARKISCYFNYIDDLIRLCKQRNLEFKTIDRLLYEFDKSINGRL